MEIMVLDTPDIDGLRPLLQKWIDASNVDRFGIPIDMEIGLATLRHLATADGCDVLAAVSGGQVVGIMGIHLVRNHIGPGMFADECLFFVDPAKRGAGISLIRAAKKWRRAKGAMRLRISACWAAGDADRTAQLLEKMNLEPYEMTCIEVA